MSLKILLTKLVNSGEGLQMLDQIKIKNIKKIMLCLIAHRCATKSQIVEDTELSTSTVSACINSLLKLKLLVSDGMKDSSGGRRSTIYRLNHAYGCFIGLVLSPEKIDGVIVDCEVKVIKRFSLPIENGAFIINAVTEILDKEISETTNVLGIGIGVSAEMDYKEQVVISAPQLKWEFVHLKEIIERQHMIFTYVDHPVNAAAVCEGMVGKACGQKNYIYVGENSGGKIALVLDGRVCRGAGNTMGEISEDHIMNLMCPEALRFLGVSQLLVSYQSPAFKDKVCACAQGFSGEIVCIEQTRDTYPIGMAAVAQRQWFESIYFML